MKLNYKNLISVFNSKQIYQIKYLINFYLIMKKMLNLKKIGQTKKGVFYSFPKNDELIKNLKEIHNTYIKRLEIQEYLGIKEKDPKKIS